MFNTEHDFILFLCSVFCLIRGWCKHLDPVGIKVFTQRGSVSSRAAPTSPTVKFIAAKGQLTA